jgi:pyruvate dehydrogenase E2 component (dihydrolipoamide acetyltransferase)
MARWEFKLPDIGEGVSEGEIVAWLVEPGDTLSEDQPMVEVMTDKATVTMTAPKAGKVVETRGRVGQTVPIGTVLVVLELDDGAPTLPPRANGTAPRSDASLAELAAAAVRPESESAAQPAAATLGYFNEKPVATPATRKFARDMRIDLRQVRPTGPQGRVTRSDVEAFGALPPTVSEPASPVGASEPGGPASPAPTPVAEPAEHVVVRPRPDEAGAVPSLQERVPMAGLRRRIAQKMSQSTAKAAHFTFVEECDVTELKSWRSRLLEEARNKGAKLSFIPFIVKAVVAALKKHPALNSTLDEAAGEIVYYKYYHIGIATATQAGLVVPVIRDADKKSVIDIAREVERLAEAARAGKSKHEDLQGSTFTITSLGAQGGLFATPIINFPEVAILGVHQIKTRPLVRDGQIVIGDVMLLSLSFDHRLVDGHVGAAFAYDVISYLERPERLLLEMA